MDSARSLDARILDAEAHHRAGRLKEAETLYRAILVENASDATALSLLGLLARQTGHSQAAANLMARSMQIDQGGFTQHADYGLALLDLGRYGPAATMLKTALDKNPESAELQDKLDLAHAKLGVSPGRFYSTDRSWPIAVVHLVRKSNGLAPFKQFVDSYRTHPAGAEHDLIFFFKGFGGDAELAAYHAELGELRRGEFRVPDVGIDLDVYGEACRRLQAFAFCFLNSYSRVTVDGWLEKLRSGLAGKGVGLAGAFGSFETPKAYLPPEQGKDFDPYPNVHVRTNGFMIPRDLMRDVWQDQFPDRIAAYRFESGQQGLTRRVLGMGLNVVVVGRDGIVHEPDQWPQSRTFRQGKQENLLVLDNRTDEFAQGDHQVRTYLGRLSWGEAHDE